RVRRAGDASRQKQILAAVPGRERSVGSVDESVTGSAKLCLHKESRSAGEGWPSPADLSPTDLLLKSRRDFARRDSGEPSPPPSVRSAGTWWRKESKSSGEGRAPPDHAIPPAL